MNNKFQGCLLGGAVGDALGYPVEFMELPTIRKHFGPNGITDIRVARANNPIPVSDDTQMTLFTANAILNNPDKTNDPMIYWDSYQRWLYTQTGRCEGGKPRKHRGEAKPYIMDQTELYSTRAPGNTCLAALTGGIPGTTARPINNSKGCGGVMRVAPCGLIHQHRPYYAYTAAVTAAAVTHGHSTGYVAAGAFAAILACLVGDANCDLDDLIIAASRIAGAVPCWQGNSAETAETVSAIYKAMDYAEDKQLSPNRAISALGRGWTAAEALSIALYCALRADNAEDAIILAVNHSGDSDSTGAICGNIVGAMYGVEALPGQWVHSVELSDYIRSTADSLCEMAGKATPVE